MVHEIDIIMSIRTAGKEGERHWLLHENDSFLGWIQHLVLFKLSNKLSQGLDQKAYSNLISELFPKRSLDLFDF